MTEKAKKKIRIRRKKERASAPVARICTEKKKEAFLAALAQEGNITAAAENAKISRRIVYEWQAVDPDFPARIEKALEQFGDLLEAEARRRAVNGVDEPVYQGGELVGHKKRYSDMLLAMLLNGNRPEKYKRVVDMNVKDTSGIAERLARAEARLAAAEGRQLKAVENG